MQDHPPKIAIFLATSGHSGVDRAARHLIAELTRRGYRVDLLRVEGHGPYIEAEHPLLHRVPLGTRHVYSALRPLIAYLRRERPDVLFADKDRVNRTALVARALSRAPCRLVLSSGTTLSLDLASRRWLDRVLQRASVGRLYRLADQVITPSAGAADDMARYTGLPRDRIAVAPRPVITNDLWRHPQPLPDHPWFHDKTVPLVLGVGELCYRKGFDVLLKAFARVHAQRRCRLMILGEGNRREQLQAQARSLELGDDLAMPGHVADPYPYMAHANLFAMSSRWEGLGFVLVEAIALGTPVVSTDCPSGPREILDDGRYGKLVPVGDDATFAAALIAALDEPPAANALREAVHPYEVESATDRYLEVMGLPPTPAHEAAPHASGQRS